MFLIDDLFKKLLDVTVDYFKNSINNSIKVKINCVNVVDPNTGVKCKGIEIINSSKNEIIINDLKVKIKYLLDGKKIPMTYQESTWLKRNLKSKDNFIYPFFNVDNINSINASNYFFISLQINNEKIINKKIKNTN